MNLVYTSSYVTPTNVTTMSVGPGPSAGQLSISYSDGTGNRFVLMSTNMLTGPVMSHEGWERVATNLPPPPASFTITPTEAQKYFYIKSE